MKKKILTAAVISAMLTLTACGDADTKTTSESKADTTTTAASEEVTTEADAEVITEATEKITDTIEEVTTELAPAVPTELSTTYADLDNRSFKYNGTLFTVGVSTLQDLLDAGAEPKKVSGSSKSEMNFDKEYSHTFKGQFPYNCLEYYLADFGTQVELYFVNPDESPRKVRDCVLANIDVRVDDSIKPASGSGIAKNLEFAFDRTLTYDALVANSGEPTYEDHGYHYAVVSEKTLNHDSGYVFGFNSKNEFTNFEITWIP
ncbi:hypothetical protein [Ruminococcus albus]|uniref:Lipoprotein n=1 Tax=Ruminococcus albus TaxID=1264 RepID=A0A1I1EHE5_RUMAL|nr:hypothetical protein [Ruminococcus albus]SFB84798.1 hypothetical protein SAMN02910406_00648 [Ruminococcus albus]